MQFPELNIAVEFAGNSHSADQASDKGTGSLMMPRLLRAKIRVRALALAAIGLLLIGGFAANAAGTPPLMATPGRMNVGSGGAFTYSVPIAVPPGTAGMGPALSLDYSSQNGDGPEGIGWSLTGLPAISRCPRTIAQDGVHGSVNFDLNDRFCFDGQRLVLVSGTYGADGSEYRTEIDTYSKILAHGTAGNGPAWFEVHTKAGQIIELGNTADSRILPVKAIGAGTLPTARAWAVDKIKDTKGNYLTVGYINDAVNGQTYPLSIHYTANDAVGLTAYNSVLFIYGSRSDVASSYQAGTVMHSTVLLSDIETSVGGTTVLDYKLGYHAATSGATHDELASITQCDGGATQKCLPPLTFSWQGSRDTLTATTVPQSFAQWSESTSLLYGSTILPGDFNGDGLTDALVLVPYQLPAFGGTVCPPPQGGPFYLGTLSGASFTPTSYNVTDETGSGSTKPFCPAKYTPPMSVTPDNPQAASFTGSGLTDLFVPSLYTGGGWSAAVNVGGSFQVKSNFDGLGPIIGDFTGDGLTDVAAALSEQWGSGTTWFSKDDGTFAFGTLPSGPPQGFLGLADADGDGCADIIGDALPTTFIITYTCNPAVPSSSTTGVMFDYDLGPPPDYGDNVEMIVTGDFNGDGKADFIDLNGVLWLSTGTGLVSAGTVPWGSTNNFISYVGDFNGDGKSDVAVNNGTQLLVFLSTGTGFALKQTVPISPADQYGVQVVVADWNNDGASDIWLQKPSGDVELLFQYIPELMTAVSNGVGATTTVTYGRLNDPTVYTKGSGATYPMQDMIGPEYVVSRIQSSDGIGGTYASSYAYAGGKNDLSGRGFLGFSQITVTDPQLHVTQTTNYRMDFPFIGQVTSQTKIWTPTTGAPVTLNAVANTYQTDANCAGVAQTHAPYSIELCSTVSQSNDTTGSVFPSVTTTYTYDGFGNILTNTALLSDGSSKTTTSTYLNDTTNWFIGRLLTASVQSVVGSSNLTRHTSFAYDPASGLVTAEIIEPQDTGALRLETDYLYDAFGNKHVTTLVGQASTTAGLVSQSRPTTTTYDARGQFATTVANALNESDQWSTNADFGTSASHSGPNGAQTTWSYDTLGRITKEARPDGTQTLYSYSYCAGVNGGSASCPTNGAYLVQTTLVAPDGVTASGPATLAYYDGLGRVLGTDTASFDASPAPWIRSETHYDTFGHAVQTSRPYFLGHDTPVFTTSSFTLNIAGNAVDTDPLARPWSQVTPDGSVTTYFYDALTSKVTNARGATTTTVKNAQGLIASVTDANGQATSYVYDSFGNTTSANPPGPAIVRYTYDLRGHKLTANDLDMGLWTYTYDAFDELASQTDSVEAANHTTTLLAYDVLGRLASRTEPDMVSTWTYGTSLSHHNIDKLVSESCVGGAFGNACASGYTRAFLYDTLARPLRDTVTVGGASFIAIPTYDSVTGKLASLRNFSGFTVNYAYTPRGYLSAITDASSGLVYFTANARDAALHLTQSTAGNGTVETHSYDPLTGRFLNVCAQDGSGACDLSNISTTFDAVGNLTNRGDTLHGVSENFSYDLLNRLSSYTVTSGSQNLSRTMRYNSAGSITEKSDVCAVNGCFAYAASQPHALSSVQGTVNGVVNPTFAYDKNGNMVSGAGRSATYTSFNMVEQVVQGTTAVGLAYDPDHARAQQSAPEGTTLYFNDTGLGAMAERFQGPTGSPVWRNYILSDNGIVAERTTQGAHVNVRYFVLDHLGSTVAMTDGNQYLPDGVTPNPAYGKLSESDAYDAWGKARDATTGADDPTCSKPAQSFSNRGFTGHEEMTDLCLVNMNARIYDPAIGRFMSPDDLIPDAYNGQSYNRYTYVDDNPLSYDDPTGHAPGNDMNQFGVQQDRFETIVADNPDYSCMACSGPLTSGQINLINHAVANLQAAGFSMSGLSISNSGGLVIATASGSFNSGSAGKDPVGSSSSSQQAAAIDGSHTSGAAKTTGCTDCTTSLDHPAREDWTLVKANNDWKGKISVWTGDHIVVVAGQLTVSATDSSGRSDMDTARTAAAEVTKYWNNVVDVDQATGTTYKSNIQMSAVDSNGDWQISRWSTSEYGAKQNKYIGSGSSGAVGAENPFGSSSVTMPPKNVEPYLRFTEGRFAHEFGHALGESHAPNETQSIMSYYHDGLRRVEWQDIRNVAGGYR
ncbi:MAG: FG-GAP-like repeat-containing protein [Rhizomicrobium sp.]